MNQTDLLEQLLDNANDIIQVSDAQTFEILYANKNAREYSGNAEAPRAGQLCHEYMFGLDDKCADCPMRDPNCREATEAEYDNGKEVFLVRTVMLDWNGRPAFVEYAHDITELYRLRASERKEFEREQYEHLEEQNKIFHALTHDLVNIYLVDLDKGTARILKLDAAYVDVPGKTSHREFPFDPVLSQWIDTVVHPDDREHVRGVLNVENMRKVFEDQYECVGTYRSIGEGDVHWFQYKMSKADAEGSLAVLGFQVIDDIVREQEERTASEHAREKAYQQKLLAAKEEAELANDAKTEFLKRMSHDVRTPLNGIRGMLDMADKFPLDVDKQAECRAKARESATLLLELINEVLFMCKLESKNIVLSHEPFDIIDVAEDVCKVALRQSAERGIQISQENCHVPHRKVIGSPAHFRHVLMNIVTNAIKFNKENGKVVVTCREAACENGVVTIEFKCRDTGIGMDPEFAKHVFEPFTQEDGEVRSEFMGTGLGMAIAKSIVDKMGGTITCESEKGVGTTFDVMIPLQIDESACSEADSGGAPAGENPLEGMRILLAEDNELNMEIAEFLVEDAGATVLKARNGLEAVEAFEQSEVGSIDAVLMDLMMPLMDGYEATEAIRALDRADAGEVPIIAMMANAFTDDRVAVHEVGMDAHVSKPIDSKRMVHVVAELVEERRNR